MKKIVVHLDLHDNKEKQKALKAVASLHGIDSIEMNMKAKNLIVIGPVDPVAVVSKLRKFWPASIVSIGPAKEPEKKEEKKEGKKEEKKEELKKEEGKKEEEKKEEPKKEDEKKGEEKKEEKKEEGKKEEEKKEEKKEDSKKDGEEKKKPIDPNELMYQNYQQLMNTYRTYNPYTYMAPQYNPYVTHPQYFVRSVEENPNSCSIM